MFRFMCQAEKDDEEDIAPPGFKITRAGVQNDHDQFEVMTDEQWDEFKQRFQNSRDIRRILENLHDVEQDILEGIVDKVSEDEEEEEEEEEPVKA